MVTDSCRKKSLRTRNDRANGNELDDMNSREHVWSEAMRAESPTQNRDPLLHRLSPGEPLRLRGTRSALVRGVQTRQDDQSRSSKQG